VADCGPDLARVGVTAVRLLELVLQLHGCSLLHAGLQPGVLASCGAAANQDWLFPLDWSSSLDLDLQKDVRSVQQIPSAQGYIRLGLLQPADPPHTVDLVGVAETIYFLLTNSEMKPERHGSSWTLKHDVFTSTWRRFFGLLLNAGGRSSISILSELKDQLSELYL
uniref:Protein kinase domain-containing protein n=2 Tax=Poecilia TaxID=8080 RepID=A0A096MGA4_POEFO